MPYKMEARMKRNLTLLALLLAGTMLSACITTTEGGFTEEASPEKALDQRVSLARQYISEGNWERARLNLQLAEDIDPKSASVANHEAIGLLLLGCRIGGGSTCLESGLSNGAGDRIHDHIRIDGVNHVIDGIRTHGDG